MRIAVLASRFPYPLERGDKLRMYHQLRYLSTQHEIHLFCTTDVVPTESQLAELKQYCKSVAYWHIDTPTYVINVLKRFSSDLPFQCSGIYDRKFHEHIMAKIIEHKIDLVYCQLIRMAPYAADVKCPVVLDYMDALGVGMERRVEVSPWYTKKLYRIEARRVQKYEKEVMDMFDHCTIISDQDKALLSVDTKGRLTTISNGIDTTYFEPDNTAPKYDIVFVGNLGYLPNIEAADILVRQIKMRYFDKYKKSLRILIVGARPSMKVLRLQTEEVKVNAWRKDIRTAYREGKILCAPLFSGTGQQNKILEAMALGIPCVTTSFVNNAIKAENGKEILMADTVAEMVAAIHFLLEDDEVYQTIERNARKFVVNNFQWQTTVDKLNSIFAAIVKQSH